MGALARFLMVSKLTGGNEKNAEYLFRAFVIIVFLVILFLSYGKIEKAIKKYKAKKTDEELEKSVGTPEESYAIRLRNAIKEEKLPWYLHQGFGDEQWSQDEAELEKIASELSGNKTMFLKTNQYYKTKYGVNILDDLAKWGEPEDLTNFTETLGFSI